MSMATLSTVVLSIAQVFRSVGVVVPSRGLPNKFAQQILKQETCRTTLNPKPNPKS